MKVSIIIPVFNVEALIADCLKSVISQTYNDLECILVDDCGNDNSIDISERFISEYQGQIKFSIIRHRHNKGLSGARNTGLKAAKGEYIYFLDSDDKITPDCIERFVDVIQSKEFDLVVADYLVEGGEDVFQHIKLQEGEYIGKHAIAEAKKKHLWFPMAWGKLYRREFLLQNNLEFCEGVLHEDELFSVELACLANSMYCLPSVRTYIYQVRPGSIMTATPYNRKMESCKVLLGHMYDFLDKNSLRKDPIANDMLYYLFSFSNEVSWRESRTEYFDRYPEYRAIICRKYGERLLGDKRLKALIRDFHYLLPTILGKYLFEMMTFGDTAKKRISFVFSYSFIRFCIVGVTATAIHYGIYWLMLKLMSPTPAFTIGYIISFGCNFFLTAKFTFKKKATPKKGVGFALSHLVNYGLETGALNVFLALGLEKEIAAIPVYFVCVPINFLLVRFVFSKL